MLINHYLRETIILVIHLSTQAETFAYHYTAYIFIQDQLCAMLFHSVKHTNTSSLKKKCIEP